MGKLASTIIKASVLLSMVWIAHHKLIQSNKDHTAGQMMDNNALQMEFLTLVN